MSRLRLIFTESIRSLGANVSTTVAATMTVLIGMFLLGLMIAFGTWTISWSNHVKRELLVKVYFADSATGAQVNAVASKLQANPLVKSVKFISKEDALKDMQRRYPTLTKNLPGNPFPNSEQVTPVHAEDIDAIAASLRPLPPGVSKVNNGAQRSHRILKVAHLIDIVFLIAVIILIAASTLLIANTIRLSIFSRRREIEVMKLVGATNWFVRGPFMLEGLICGVGGALTAVLLLILSKEVVLPSILGHLDAGPDVHAWPFWLDAVLLVAAGLGLGAAGSGLTLRRFLKV
ncbi:MAG TPA: permease-like cell division protein FtsX [Gaiellaceae bacterium]|jgi:cell division transport system permease protein